ncbi:MAG: hypothetical protein R2788_21250 [Saprospiraceae bacterium]
MKSTSFPSLTQLAFWAKAHPVTARWIITINRILLGYAAFYGGVVLADRHVFFSEKALVASAVVFAIAYLCYPRKDKRWPVKTPSFALRKSCDFLLIASSCIFWLAAGNFILPYQPTAFDDAKPPVETLPSVITKDGKAIYYSNPPASQTLKKAKQARGKVFKKIRGWRVRFFQKLKARVSNKLAIIKHAYKKMDGATIALLILASLAIIGLLGYLTLALSCSLSCNGQEGAASLVAILGCFTITGLVAWMWTAASKKDRSKSEKTVRRKTTATPPQPIEREVVNPNLKVCLETDDPKGLDGATLTLNGNVLEKNTLPDSQPNCFDLTVEPDQVNKLQVTGANGPVRVSIEDGIFLKKLTLPMNGENADVVHLILKQP